MYLLFQVPMQYCSLQHLTLFSPPDIPWISLCFDPDSSGFDFILSGSISNFSLLFTSSILDTFWSGNSFSSVIYFCFFIVSMGFCKQEYWNGLTSPPLVDQFCQNSLISCYYDLPIYDGPTCHGSQLIKLCEPLHHKLRIIHFTYYLIFLK